METATGTMESPQPLESPSGTEPQPLRLLVLEDNPDDLFLIEDMLAEAQLSDLELRHADALAPALEALAHADCDLVLSDLTLPDSDGLETFRSVRRAAPDVPVIILTGLQDQAMALDAVREGAQDYLVKGEVDAQTLGRAITYAMERFGYTEALRTSHDRFRCRLQQSAVAMLVLDRQGKTLYANPAAGTLLGREPADLVGATLEVDTEATREVHIELPDGKGGRTLARVSETVWDGSLGYLATLAGYRPAGASPTAPLETLGPVSRFEGIRTASPAMQELFATCERVAPTPASVLILGETGTGKELLARAIHRRSGRSGRFVAVNCAAIPENLVESELFGHEKGSFTGASSSRPGLFRQAEGGTLLLDEVGNLDTGAQLSLLRTLQERTVRPVGSTREVPVDVRVVAATGVPLHTKVAEGVFREDLLYRLDVIRLEVLPLRERPEDVLHLFRHFCRTLAKRYEVDTPELGQGFLQAMVTYPWPGNVRQLENFAERLLLTATSDAITARQFHELIRPYRRTDAADPAEPTSSDPAQVDLSLSMADFLDAQEKAYVTALLEETQGRIQKAAERAGVNRRTMLRKIKKFELNKEDYR